MYSFVFIINKLIVGIVFFFYAEFLSLEKVGVWDVFITTMYLIVPILSMQLPYAVFRYAGDYQSKYCISKIFSLLHILFWLSLILFLILLLLKASTFYYLIPFSISYIGVIFQIEFAKGRERLIQSALIEFTGISIPLIVSVLYLFLYNDDIEFIKIIVGMSAVLTLLIYYLITVKNVKIGLQKTEFNIRQLLSYSIPLIPNGVAWLLLNSSYKYIIMYDMGEEFVGLFAINFKFAWLIPIFGAFIIIHIQKHALSLFNNNNNVFYWFEGNIVKGSVILGALYVVFFIFLVLLKNSELDLESINNIDLLVLAMLFVASYIFFINSLYGVLFIVFEETRLALVPIVIALIVALILTVLFINSLGLKGVALALILGGLANLYARKVQIKKLKVLYEYKS